MSKPPSIAAHLYNARLNLNLSQAEVAEMLGVNQCTVYNYETGRSLPPHSKLEKLCRIYSLDYEATKARVERILIQRWEHT